MFKLYSIVFMKRLIVVEIIIFKKIDINDKILYM